MSREQEIVRRHFYYALDELSGQWVRMLRVQEIDFEWAKEIRGPVAEDKPRTLDAILKLPLFFKEAFLTANAQSQNIP
jgi:hypothetical protein